MSEMLARRRSLVETTSRPSPVTPTIAPTGTPARERRPLASGLIIRRDNLATFFALATQLHVEGHLDDARELYLRILATDDTHADAWHQLGVLAHQSDEPLAALNHLRHAIALNASEANYFVNLGDVFRSLARFPEAIMVFDHALMMDPTDADAACGIGHSHLQEGEHALASAAYRRTIELSPTSADAHSYLGVALRHEGKLEEAIGALERAIELEPEHVEAAYLLAALKGEATPRAPREYVRDLFDGYADTFDTHLVGRLGYEIPRLTREIVSVRANPPRRGWRIADLGCGTGLCGQELAAWASHLIGIDLSPRMIARADERGVYDELRVADLEDGLTGDAPFDLLVAGDVFIYLGALEKALAQCHAALADGGWLCFSVEETTNPPFELLSTGRYAHSHDYVQTQAEKSGLRVVEAKPIPVRHESGRAIPGRLYLMQRDAA